MNTITITINGMEYNLKGEEKEEYLRTVGNYVDKKIKNILENNEKLSTSEAAILTALNVTDDMFKLGHESEKLADDVELIRKKAVSLEENKKELKDEIDSVNKKNDELLAKIKEMENTVNKNSEDEIVKLKGEINRLTKENQDMKAAVQKHLLSAEKYKNENKELRFKVHTLKYKVIDLENKFLENQIDLAKAKKQVVDVLSDDTKINKKVK